MKKRWLIIVLGLIPLIFFYVELGITQPTEELNALRKEIEAVKQGQQVIQKDLQEIKELLTRGRQAPPSPVQSVNVGLSVAGDPLKGDKNARVTLIEFSDYQCPFCARHLYQTAPQIEKDYIQTGKVRYVLKDFPIASIHPQAFKGHEAAHCAGESGKYWEMHSRLFANQKAMSPKDLSDHAQALALDMPKFQQCLDGGKYASKIRNDISDGQKAGVQGTPTFFLGYTEPNDSKVKVMQVIRGAQPYAAFKGTIDSLLAGQK